MLHVFYFSWGITYLIGISCPVLLTMMPAPKETGCMTLSAQKPSNITNDTSCGQLIAWCYYSRLIYGLGWNYFGRPRLILSVQQTLRSDCPVLGDLNLHGFPFRHHVVIVTENLIHHTSHSDLRYLSLFADCFTVFLDMLVGQRIATDLFANLAIASSFGWKTGAYVYIFRLRLTVTALILLIWLFIHAHTSQQNGTQGQGLMLDCESTVQKLLKPHSALPFWGCLRRRIINNSTSQWRGTATRELLGFWADINFNLPRSTRC